MRKRSKLITMFAGVVVAAGAAPAPAAAHHGWGLYQDAQFEITGTLEEPVSLAGPHATATLRAGEDVWDLVLAPSIRTVRAGLDEDTIPVGAEVTASGHRHLDAATLEVKVERLTWDDRMFNVYPDRN